MFKKLFVRDLISITDFFIRRSAKSRSKTFCPFCVGNLADFTMTPLLRSSAFCQNMTSKIKRVKVK